METKFKIPQNWNEIKIRFIKEYANVAESDLDFITGREDELIAHLEQKLGMTSGEVVEAIEDVQLELAKRAPVKGY